MNKRIAVRAVIFDEEMNTPILSVRAGEFYKIPGGKVENGEEILAGLAREIKEEAGCEAEIISKIGEFEFVMKEDNQINHSICYLAKLKGEKGEPDFDQGEKQNNFKLIWVNIDKAIEMFEACVPKTEDLTEVTIHTRDLNFLKKAKSLINDMKF